MAGSNPQNGGLPQQVPQQYADGKNFTPSASYQAPDVSLPQILATIGGLGLNVAGAVTRTGAAGNSSLEAGDRIGRDADSAAQANFTQQKFAEKEVKDRDQARALYARANELPTAQRAEFEAAAKNGDVSHMLHALDRNESFNRGAKTQQRLQDDGYFKQVRSGLNSELKDADFQAKQAGAAFNPAAEQALREQAFFAAQKDPSKLGMEDLVTKWNAAKGNKQIKNGADKAAFYDRFRGQINETAQPGAILNAISNIPIVGSAIANSPTAKGLLGNAASQPFDGYAAKQVTQEAVQQHQSALALKAAAEAKKQKAFDALKVLNNTKDKGAAVEAAQAVMAGGQSAPQAAPLQRIKDAKGNQFDWNPKTGAMTPVGK